jgi:group II intron reverse transcriptase/maturase
MDIKGFFDNIDHEKMLSMLRKLTDKKHILLYCERWLKAPMQTKEGLLKERTKGSPQGGVISPLLANIYLSEAIDNWIKETQPGIVFERYADDIIIHTYSMKQSQFILNKLKERLKQYKLELSESKTKIVYCHKAGRQFNEKKAVAVSFDFLGFTFKPRICQRKDGLKFLGFCPAISMKSQKRILRECKKLAFHNWVQLDIYKLSQVLTPKIRGWIHYYGKVRLGDMQRVFSLINRRIAKWIQKKFKIRTIAQAYGRMKRIIKSFPTIFEHWKYGFTG